MMNTLTLEQTYRNISQKLAYAHSSKDYDGKLLHCLSSDYDHIARLLHDARQAGQVEQLVGELRHRLNRMPFYLHARERGATLARVADTIERIAAMEQEG